MKKFLLLTIVVFLLLPLSACVSTVEMSSSADKVANAASAIADFEPPAGYSSDFTATLMGYTVAAYNPGDGHSHLYLVQSEEESDAEKLAQMLAELVPGSSDPNTRLTVIENRPVTLRGQETTLVISDGVDSQGETYRQVTAAFQGKGGPALLVLSEPIESWDQSEVDAFIASIQ
jgi:hypothetical protein